MNQLLEYSKLITPVREAKFMHIFCKSKYMNLPILLEDDHEYIIYRAWIQPILRDLYAKYFPKTSLCYDNDKVTNMIMFHGGCTNCSSQHNYLIEKRCVKCRYFKGEWSKEDLSI